MNAAFQEGVFVRGWEGEGSCEGLGKGGLNLGQPCLNCALLTCLPVVIYMFLVLASILDVCDKQPQSLWKSEGNNA